MSEKTPSFNIELTPEQRAGITAIGLLKQRMGEEAAVPRRIGLIAGPILGGLGGTIYTFTSPRHRQKWLKNLLLLGGGGILAGAIIGERLGISFSDPYVASRFSSIVDEIVKNENKRIEEAGWTPQAIEKFLSAVDSIRANWLPGIFWGGAVQAAGTLTGLAVGIAMALESKRRRKEWFEHLLTYATIGTIIGRIGGRLASYLVFKALTSQAQPKLPVLSSLDFGSGSLFEGIA